MSIYELFKIIFFLSNMLVHLSLINFYYINIVKNIYLELVSGGSPHSPIMFPYDGLGPLQYEFHKHLEKKWMKKIIVLKLKLCGC